MTKLLFAAALLLASTHPSFAQSRDTAFAVHKLFVQKRGHGVHTAGAGASLATEAATLRGAIIGSVVGAAPVVVGLAQAGRYSPEREQAVLSGYAAGAAIPADVRHALRRKYFHRSATDVASERR
ncbi:hypothetical protein GCM10027422_20160 [Hymenobacter arcticus]